VSGQPVPAKRRAGNCLTLASRSAPARGWRDNCRHWAVCRSSLGMNSSVADEFAWVVEIAEHIGAGETPAGGMWRLA
jgi:hypothetical protein